MMYKIKQLFTIAIIISLLFPSTIFAKKKSKKSKTAIKNINRVYGKAGILKSNKPAMLVSSGYSNTNNVSINNSPHDITSYKKVSLFDVVYQAIARSKNVKAAREKVVQSELALKDGYAGYLPIIDTKYSAARSYKTPYPAATAKQNPEKKTFNDQAWKFTVSQNIYAGGSTETKIKSLKKSFTIAKNRYRLTIDAELQKAVKAYFDVVFAHKSLLTNEANMKRLLKLLNIVNMKYDSGAMSIGDLSAIKASIANAKVKLSKNESKFNTALEYYEYIAGNEFRNTIPYESEFDTSIGTLDDIVELALKYNLNIMNYNLNISSEKYKLQNAKSNFRPKIDLEVSANRIFDSETLFDNPSYPGTEDTYKAKITASYNIYNGGKDKNKYLKSFSTISELRYRLQEEIQKLTWKLSKLHISVKSTSEVIGSLRDEVDSSTKMVGAYWESFQSGEQDLQELLQGQRQLNSAELNLIDNSNSNVSDYFKMLSETGTALSYFGLDDTDDKFLDFSRSSYRVNNPIIKLSQNKLAIQEALDLNTSNVLSENNESESVENNDSNITNEVMTTEEANASTTLYDVLDYTDKFLESNDNNYTLKIGEYGNIYEGLREAERLNLDKKVFLYQYLKDEIFKTSLATGIFVDYQDANNTKNDLLGEDENLSIEILKLSQVKETYKKYLGKILPKKVIEYKKVYPPKEKPFETNLKFKEKFLKANPENFTINIVSLANMEQAKSLLKKYDIYDNSFVFKYGANLEWLKVMYGVFSDYDQAVNKLESMKDIKKLYYPTIEKIAMKQNLYKKYNAINTNESNISIPLSNNKKIDKQKTEDENSSKVIITDNNVTKVTLENVSETNSTQKPQEIKEDVSLADTFVKRIYLISVKSEKNAKHFLAGLPYKYLDIIEGPGRFSVVRKVKSSEDSTTILKNIRKKYSEAWMKNIVSEKVKRNPKVSVQVKPKTSKVNSDKSKEVKEQIDTEESRDDNSSKVIITDSNVTKVTLENVSETNSTQKPQEIKEDISLADTFVKRIYLISVKSEKNAKHFLAGLPYKYLDIIEGHGRFSVVRKVKSSEDSTTILKNIRKKYSEAWMKNIVPEIVKVDQQEISEAKVVKKVDKDIFVKQIYLITGESKENLKNLMLKIPYLYLDIVEGQNEFSLVRKVKESEDAESLLKEIQRKYSDAWISNIKTTDNKVTKIINKKEKVTHTNKNKVEEITDSQSSFTHMIYLTSLQSKKIGEDLIDSLSYRYLAVVETKPGVFYLVRNVKEEENIKEVLNKISNKFKDAWISKYKFQAKTKG